MLSDRIIKYAQTINIKMSPSISQQLDFWFEYYRNVCFRFCFTKLEIVDSYGFEQIIILMLQSCPQGSKV